MSKQAIPFGSWSSPVTAELVAKQGVRLGHMQVFEGRVYWLESRPQEQGRGVIVCCDGQSKTDVTPEDMSVRTKVHEMGGGDFLVCQLGIFFVNAIDQAVYLTDTSGNTKAITTVSDDKSVWRFADFSITPDLAFLFSVRERHDISPVKNELVSIELKTGEVRVVAEGHDFYSFPRVSPQGHRLCWTCWNHPQMPWDGTELWVADIHRDGSVNAAHKVCGGEHESIYQPAWSPDGVLHFVSDRSGWWNLYSFRDGVLNALTPTDNDCGIPQWVFGTSSYCFASESDIYFAFFEEGQQQLAHLDVDTGHIEPLELPFREYPGQLQFDSNKLYMQAGGPALPLSVFEVELSSGHYRDLVGDGELPVPIDFVSIAKPVRFTSASGYQSHGFFYEPLHPEFCGLDDEKPPLLVMSHGGPTGHTSSSLNWQIQYWTTRGFAVVDVNYAGSTGFGREYRDLLNEQWGINDVNDCVYAARYLVEDELVDGDRLMIRGGSAGGFTTLCALAFFDDFAAGMSRYGVADLEALAKDTHKFEARYLDNLVGPYPEARSVYQERSPIHHASELSCPILILQGADDPIVPPSQSQELVKALAEKDIPHAYIEFEGEGHGFRKQENIVRALQAELSFYRQVLHIDSEEQLEQVPLNG